jgi:N-acyl-D-aspartate/D-glutamate deacylase
VNVFINSVVCLSVFTFVSTAFSDEGDHEFDLVIRHGTVVDGTGNPWFKADIGVKNDRIAAIGSITKKGKLEIDATGLVVAPGFIDIHSHSDFYLLRDGHAQSKIRQGVTTEILGEGNSAGPYQGKLSPKKVIVNGQTAHLTRLADYFELIEKSKVPVNVASYVGINNIWQSVMGAKFDRPTLTQIEKMKSLVDEAMQDGALGLSSQVMMPDRKSVV